MATTQKMSPEIEDLVKGIRKLKIHVQKTAQLKPYVDNPRAHPESQITKLAEFIKIFGFLVPIVVDAKGEIVAGHGRLLAAERLDLPEVPTLRADNLTPEQIRAFRIADNKIAESDWLEEALRSELDALAELDFDMGLTGFTAEELEALRSEPEPVLPPGPDDQSPKGKDDFLGNLEKKWEPKPGQIWQIPSMTAKGSNHRLVCGDSRDPAAIEALMNGRQAAMVFTDPPYGVEYISRGGHDTIAGDDLKRDQLVEFLHACFQHLIKHTDDYGAFYIWHASETRDDFAYAMKAAGLQERQYLIWAKQSIVLGWSDYRWAHEPCFYAGKAGFAPHFYGGRNQGTVWRIEMTTRQQVGAVIGPGLIINDGQGNEICVTAKIPTKKLRRLRIPAGKPLFLDHNNAVRSVWEVPRDGKTRHATQKPAKLGMKAIQNSSLPGQIVLDIFLGSGSTMIAAETKSRICYGIEISTRNIAGILEWMADAGCRPQLTGYYTESE